MALYLRSRAVRAAAVAAVAAALLLAWVAAAQGEYHLMAWTVDGGGYTFSQAGGYSLGQTSGQPDAGLLAGGGYTLAGGFWSGDPLPTGPALYLPLVLKGG